MTCAHLFTQSKPKKKAMEPRPDSKLPPAARNKRKHRRKPKPMRTASLPHCRHAECKAGNEFRHQGQPFTVMAAGLTLRPAECTAGWQSTPVAAEFVFACACGDRQGERRSFVSLCEGVTLSIILESFFEPLLPQAITRPSSFRCRPSTRLASRMRPTRSHVLVSPTAEWVCANLFFFGIIWCMQSHTNMQTYRLVCSRFSTTVAASC